jgi:hypothetical protein
MRLYEFAEDDPLRVKLAAVTNQLKERTKRSGSTLSTDELLEFLRKNRIVLDKSDLYDIVQKEPLSNIIKSVNKDVVTFVGQSEEDTEIEPRPDDSEKIRQQMASKAIR